MSFYRKFEFLKTKFSVPLFFHLHPSTLPIPSTSKGLVFSEQTNECTPTPKHEKSPAKWTGEFTLFSLGVSLIKNVASVNRQNI